MPNYYGPYPAYPQPVQQAPMQIQNGGFVSVRGEMEARNYPVAPGNSVTFKDETAPYVYTKTMGFSQLDRPVFDKYRLVKEEVAEASNLPQNEPNVSKVDADTIENIKKEIEAIWDEIEGIKNVSVKRANIKRKEDGGSD